MNISKPEPNSCVKKGLECSPEWQYLTKEEQEIVSHPSPLGEKESLYPLSFLEVVALTHVSKENLDYWFENGLIKSIRKQNNTYYNFYASSMIKILYLKKQSKTKIDELISLRKNNKPSLDKNKNSENNDIYYNY